METTMTAASARKKIPCPTEGAEQDVLARMENIPNTDPETGEII